VSTGPGVLDVDGTPVRVTHLDKVLYPATGTTKAEVIAYVLAVAPALLRQLDGRPVTRMRWPHGTGAARFVEKNTPKGAPPWLRHRVLPASPGDDEGTTLDLPFLDELRGLVWAANAAALELHTPQWRVGPRGAVHDPDRLVVDLDPGPGAGLEECAEVAHLVAERLAADGLTHTVPVTSGSKGLQLYAPFDAPRPAAQVRDLAHRLAADLARARPDLVVAVMRRDLRGGKVLIDWSQNHPAKTTITPYSLRGGPAPFVAAPRRWEEIGPGLTHLTPADVVDRLATCPDPFA
jgi:bifunctional non-homologous end joining protein LigD